MKQNIKWRVRKYLPIFRLLNYFRLLCTRKKSYLFRTGWVESILRGYPCDKQGNELPWMNYSFIFFIRERLKDDMTLLEFGGGFSTIFWAKYIKMLCVVEHDVFFLEMLKDKLPTNTQIFPALQNNDVPYSEHAKIVSEKNDNILFDIIVIDGIDWTFKLTIEIEIALYVQIGMVGNAELNGNSYFVINSFGTKTFTLGISDDASNGDSIILKSAYGISLENVGIKLDVTGEAIKFLDITLIEAIDESETLFDSGPLPNIWISSDNLVMSVGVGKSESANGFEFLSLMSLVCLVYIRTLRRRRR